MFIKVHFWNGESVCLNVELIRWYKPCSSRRDPTQRGTELMLIGDTSSLMVKETVEEIDAMLCPLNMQMMTMHTEVGAKLDELINDFAVTRGSRKDGLDTYTL